MSPLRLSKGSLPSELQRLILSSCFEVHQVCQVLFRHGAEVRVLRYLQGGNSEEGGCRSEQWQIPLLDWHPNTSKYPLQWDDKFFHISDWR